MATKQATKPTPNVPTPVKGQPNAALLKRMSADSRRGLSSDQADNLVPLIYVLQAQSPQVLKRNPAFIDGAEAGSIWFRNAANPIVSGEKGFIFQPCYFNKDWVEWVPRDDGGGFVGRHQELPPDAQRQEDEKNPNRVSYIRKNGNEVIETRYHVGYVYGRGNPQPFVIPLHSTGHTFSRTLMFAMNSKQLADGSIPPSFASFYRLFTKPRSNARGEWYGWEFEDLGWVEREEDYARGEALNAAFASGEKKVEEPEQSAMRQRGGDDDNM